VADKSLTLDQFRTLRKDNWWVQPLLVVVGLGGFGIYATWAALQNANYYAAPYLSPFYSPCISANCAHLTLPLIGSWWNLSPAFLILWVPGGFRATCYYYRKAYYRSFFQSPPACAVRDTAKNYRGETRFPPFTGDLGISLVGCTARLPLCRWHWHGCGNHRAMRQCRAFVAVQYVV